MHSAISPCLKIDLKLLKDLRIKMGENTLFSSVKMKFSCFNWNQCRYLSNQNLKHSFPGPVVFLGQRHNRVYFMSKCNWRVNENMGKDFADFSVYRNTQRRKQPFNGGGKWGAWTHEQEQGSQAVAKGWLRRQVLSLQLDWGPGSKVINTNAWFIFSLFFTSVQVSNAMKSRHQTY